MFLKKVEAMAFSRDNWISKASQRLEGALGEYAKLQYAKAISFPDYWSDEVKRLMGKVEELFDPAKVKTKQKFDRRKAFLEAVNDSKGSQEQLTSARNEFLQHLSLKEKQVFLKARIGFDSEDLLMQMLSEHLPKDILDLFRTKP